MTTPSDDYAVIMFEPKSKSMRQARPALDELTNIIERVYQMRAKRDGPPPLATQLLGQRVIEHFKTVDQELLRQETSGGVALGCGCAACCVLAVSMLVNQELVSILPPNDLMRPDRHVDSGPTTPRNISRFDPSNN